MVNSSETLWLKTPFLFIRGLDIYRLNYSGSENAGNSV